MDILEKVFIFLAVLMLIYIGYFFWTLSTITSELHGIQMCEIEHHGMIDMNATIDFCKKLNYTSYETFSYGFGGTQDYMCYKIENGIKNRSKPIAPKISKGYMDCIKGALE